MPITRKTGGAVRPLALGLLVAGLLSSTALAANPELVVHAPPGAPPPSGGAKLGSSSRLAFDRLDIDIEVTGGVARTVVTAQLANHGDGALEGEFTFDLPAGSSVTGYALDVNGTMVDGVLVDRTKGQRAYERKVRQGVDPGLAEVTRDNAFKRRVFPIWPGRPRSVRLSFVTPIAEALSFPLHTEAAVGAYSLHIHDPERELEVESRRPDGERSALEAQAGSGVDVRLNGQNRPLNQTLTIRPSAPARGVHLDRGASGQTFV